MICEACAPLHPRRSKKSAKHDAAVNALKQIVQFKDASEAQQVFWAWERQRGEPMCAAPASQQDFTMDSMHQQSYTSFGTAPSSLVANSAKFNPLNPTKRKRETEEEPAADSQPQPSLEYATKFIIAEKAEQRVPLPSSFQAPFKSAEARGYQSKARQKSSDAT